MLETCRGGLRPVRLCVEKTKNFGQIQPPQIFKQKWTKILIGRFSPNLGGLPYMLETCRGGPRPVRLRVEQTKNFGQIRPLRTCRQKWTKILVRPLFPKFEAP